MTDARRIYALVIASPAEQPKWTEVGGFWVSVAVAIIGVIAFVVGATATYRASRPNRVLRWGYKVIPITDDRLRQSGLSVVYNDEPLRGALTAEVTLKNDCRKDFVAADFEDGEPLKVRVKERILNILDIDFKGTYAPPPRIEHDHDNDGSIVTIQPSLFPAGSSICVRLLLADDKGATVQQFAVFSGHEIEVGLPKLQLISPIKDVAVRFNNPASNRYLTVALWASIAFTFGLFVSKLAGWWFE